MVAIPQLNQPNVVGNERFQYEKRRIAAVLLAISISVAYFPLARLAPLINRDGGTAPTAIAMSALFGNLIALTIGLTGMTIAFMVVVFEWNRPSFTGSLTIFEITALVPYFTDIVSIGKSASTGAAFIPEVYAPTESQVWFVGAMGMIGAATFCLFLFGSVAFLTLELYKFQTGSPESYTGSYYKNRLVFYSAFMALAGLAQLMLGSFIIKNFGNGGALPEPIVVAMFVVFFPQISVTVGAIYMLNGFWGMARGLKLVPANENDVMFPVSMWIQYICTIVLMIVVQTSYAPGPALAPAAPTVANLVLGVHIMPAYLDYKSRNIPNEIDVAYYGIEYSGNKSMEEESGIKEEQAMQVNEDKV